MRVAYGRSTAIDKDLIHIRLMEKGLKLRAGEWVEVLSKKEILETLDKRGATNNLPFMPEMFRYCGQRFKVFKRAHKTCDPPNGIGGRRMKRAVHLEDIRCDGQAHGGCQAACLLFWKDVWLKRLGGHQAAAVETVEELPFKDGVQKTEERCTEADIWTGTHAPAGLTDYENPTYICQSTQLSLATEPWHWWDPRQYLEDYTSGNVRLSKLLYALLFFIYSNVAGAGIGLGSGMRWIYDRYQKMRGGSPYPWRTGKISRGAMTPSSKLNLQPGEIVKVKSYSDILQTVDENMCNRGMYFDGEMVPFTEKSFRVLKRVEKIIDEKSGKMVTIKSDAVILEDVTCQALYSRCRTFCSRSIYPYWREIWLERIEDHEQKE